MLSQPKVVCVCTGTKYPPIYVERLYKSLVRNSTIPFTFECIRETKYPGWWGKLELFPPKERIVYLDLDVVVTGNVDFLFDYEGQFIIGKNCWNSGGFDASIMGIGENFGGFFRDAFEQNPEYVMGHFYSDQEFMRSAVSVADFWQDFYPGKIMSFKGDNLEQDFKGASIVEFHGNPKPHECMAIDWVRENWK